MWTPDALRSEARPWNSDLWRAVESQAKISTMRLTDTLAEQELLEAVLERSKPSWPDECQGLHYLLATPFRYAPYPQGSRFRRPGQREGAFYCSELAETAVGETSFYRLLFFAESPGMRLPSSAVEHTVFSVRCQVSLALNLSEPPLDRDSHVWREPVDYSECQALADEARAAGVQAIRYLSVRDPLGGMNCALLSAAAFAAPHPIDPQTWHIFPREHTVRAWCENPPRSLEFRREEFNDPRLTSSSGTAAGETSSP
jgi:hypothetical protein